MWSVKKLILAYFLSSSKLPVIIKILLSNFTSVKSNLSFAKKKKEIVNNSTIASLIDNAFSTMSEWNMKMVKHVIGWKAQESSYSKGKPVVCIIARSQAGIRNSTVLK